MIKHRELTFTDCLFAHSSCCMVLLSQLFCFILTKHYVQGTSMNSLYIQGNQGLQQLGVSPVTQLTALELYSVLALPGPKPYPTPEVFLLSEGT